MSTFPELRASLETSLREVFGAAVSDVLAAVERSVAGWREREAACRERADRAEAHNTQLRGLLLLSRDHHAAAGRAAVIVIYLSYL